MATQGFERGRGAAPGEGEQAWWFVWRARELLVVSGPAGQDDGGRFTPPLAVRAQLGEANPRQPLVIGYLDGVPCVAGMAPDDAPLPQGMITRDLRRLYDLLDETTYSLASYSYQIAYWQETSGYCPVCGGPATLNEADWGRTCPRCGHIGYPRVSPCIIVLIHDGGDRVLLARQPSWPKGRYSLVAGFVEAAESLEECLVREVREEVGVQVTDLTYISSQAWSFPHQLMVGYTARHSGGEIAIDPAELEDARWFSLDDLPALPPPLSIARRIIDDHRARRGHQDQPAGGTWE